MGIKISIIVQDDNIADQLDDRECTLQEVSVALLRLKQIEQKLIDKDFESKFEVEEL